VSELHAIDVDTIRFGEDYRDVSYSPALGLLSKTQSPEDTQRALAKVTVKSLCETVDDRMSDDKKLCSIRARCVIVDTEFSIEIKIGDVLEGVYSPPLLISHQCQFKF
jgi:hypothetical protein